jgi:hypothetical protein
MSHQANAAVRKPALDAASTLELLADDDVRALFEAVEEPRTIPQLAAECDLPRSTAYRKTNRLVEAGILVPTTQTAGETDTATEYRRTVDGIRLEVGDGMRVEFLR